MKKRKLYKSVRFGAEVIKQAHEKLTEVAISKKIEITGNIFKVDHDDSTWTYDTKEEFFF